MVQSEVTRELALIEKHAGFAPSPIFIYDEDYSQYVPRGHYTRSETLKRYFKAMLWYGRMTCLLKGNDSFGPGGDALISVAEARIQTFQAALLTLGLVLDVPVELLLQPAASAITSAIPNAMPRSRR